MKLKHLIVTASIIAIIGVGIFQITNFNDNKELQTENMNNVKFSNVQASIKNDNSIIVESLPVPDNNSENNSIENLPVPDTSVEIEPDYLN